MSEPNEVLAQALLDNPEIPDAPVDVQRRILTEMADAIRAQLGQLKPQLRAALQAKDADRIGRIAAEMQRQADFMKACLVERDKLK